MKTISKEGYYKSMERFNKIDGDNFSPCMRQVFDHENCNVLEWRVRESDKNLCVIQFYDEGKGYQIFEAEKIKKEAVFSKGFYGSSNAPCVYVQEIVEDVKLNSKRYFLTADLSFDSFYHNEVSAYLEAGFEVKFSNEI